VRTAKRNIRCDSIPGTILLGLLLMVASSLDGPATAANDPFDATQCHAVIDTVLNAFAQHYVYPEVVDQMEQLIRRRQTEGAYADATDLSELCRRLRHDLRDLTGDRHIWIDPMPEDAFWAAIDDTLSFAQIQHRARQNFAFKKTEWLPGNVGYLRFDRFDDPAFAGDTAASALQFLANCDAVIVDLRYNHGGEDQMVRFLASYFFAEPRLLGTLSFTQADSVEQAWTYSYVPGRKLIDAALYILTSAESASGAEAFTYGLKHQGRATVIGEPTRGSAHWTEGFNYPELNLRVEVPIARPINPATGTSWEGSGVQPDQVVPAEQALITAHVTALENLRGQTSNSRHYQELDWVLADLRAQLDPVELTSDQLGEYVGGYGPHRIYLDDGQLYYQRDERQPYGLAPLANDLFRVGDLDYFRLRFTRDDRGQVVKVVGLYDDGQTDENTRDKR